VRPVLDLRDATSDVGAVDQHDPPDPMRDLVILRDGHCVFPGCTVDARRCDQDHTVPYVPMDEGGPPGQTSPANLACLCRRHHRLKTFTGWTYQRAGPDTYTWTNPHGLTYTSGPIPKH
jgi:5-methylcytosine-specific restriction endonuclease McrA